MNLHTYLSAVGYDPITRQSDIDAVLDGFVSTAVRENRIDIDENNPLPEGLYEARIRQRLLSDALGNDVGAVVIRGLYDPAKKSFERQFYYPEIVGRSYDNVVTDVELEMERDRDIYLVHCDSIGNELEPIFFLSNSFDFVKEYGRVESIKSCNVVLGGLSVEGKIILPINKTDEQISKQHTDFRKRIGLVQEIKGGNQDAASQLAMIDYDAIADICRRVQNSDIYSVVDSSFVPSGMECDTYKVVGNIIYSELITNSITGGQVYYMDLECNNERLSIAINDQSLMGTPVEGLRFVGRVWLQGRICKSND